MILFINACVRRDSRTKLLADYLLTKQDDTVEEVRVHELAFPAADEDFLQQRDMLIDQKRFDHPLFTQARTFAGADQIVIAAPYWDLSFPAAFKIYLEQINVRGVTFEYTEEGIPRGLCRAKRLYYVMTAGGNYVPEEYGFGYVSALARGYYGITESKLISAVGLDIKGADESAILADCRQRIDALFS